MADIHYGDSPVELRKYLQGIEFPATREELIDQARANGASHKILQYLAKLPDQEYTGLFDVIPDMLEGEY